jgi:S-adenosylmethionine synthetase
MFTVKEEKKNSSVSKITITTQGFTEVNEPIQMEETDPIFQTIVADINSDGFDELFLITQSTGSGSYGTIYGFASNNDKSVTPIYIPKISENDLKGDFKGYRA